MRAETADLTEGVNSGVGATRAVQRDIFLRQAAQHIDDFTLNGGFIFLDLPAVEIRAIVGDG